MTTAHLATVKDIQEKSGSFIRHNSGCWLWMGTKNEKGYGKLTHLGNMQSAHRWFYEIIHSTIPEGLEIDHLCRVRNCVNPNHLEPVTHQENVERSLPTENRHLCKRGHNKITRIVKGKTVFHCRICKRASTQAARRGITIEQQIDIMIKKGSRLIRHN